MTQRTINILLDEIYSKGPKQNFITNKTDVYYLDDICFLDIVNLKDYGRKSNKGYEYDLVAIGILGSLDGQLLQKVKMLKQ